MVVTPNKENSNALNLLFIIGLIFCLYILKPIVVPLIIALILTVSIFPLVNFLEKKWRANRVISALTAIFTLSIILFGLLAFIVYELTDILEKSDLYILKLTEVYNSILSYLDANFGIRKSELSLKKFNMGATIKDNFTNIIGFLTSSGSIFSDIILIPLYIFFFLIYRKFFKSFIFKAFSSDGNDLRVKSVLAKLYKVQQNYLYGLFTVMFIVGLLNSVGLLILSIENAFFFGFLAAILLLIPYIEIMIGSLLPALVALATKDSAWYAAGVIAIFMFIQVIEGNYITPKITGSKVSINSFVAILSIVLFSMLWGTAGMIVALPVVASLKVVFDTIPELKPYGFLIGEPMEEYLRSDARIRLKNWKKIRKEKIENF
jgi:predicted PurR-regulated permease PerM